MDVQGGALRAMKRSAHGAATAPSGLAPIPVHQSVAFKVECGHNKFFHNDLARGRLDVP